MTTDSTAERPAPPKLRLGWGAVVVLVIGALSVTVGLGLLRGQQGPDAVIPHPEPPIATSSFDIYVHVLGAVVRPGLYVLDADARVVDALAAAGGTLEEADLHAVNLARPLTDGEQLSVPAVGESVAENATSGIGADGRVNLNTASRAELETLPRIGPALAQRIVSWREAHGRFRSVQDLLAVPGIGEKLLAGLKDAVRT